MAGLPACLWAFAFAAVHVYWLAGGAIGLPPAIAAERPPMLMLAAALAVPLLAAAGAVAVAGPRLRARVPRVAAVCAIELVTAFCLVHALPPLVLAAVGFATGHPPRGRFDGYALLLYEPNWLVGGLLFGKALRDTLRAGRAYA